MVPSEVLLAEAAPMIHHRTVQFSSILTEVADGLKKLFGTQEDVYLIAGSGTAAMEAAVANVCSPGEKAICAVGGKFGERWAELCAAYGCEVVAIELDWGKSLDLQRARSALKEHPDARAFYMTHSETSTGALNDVEGLSSLTRQSDTLLVVDSITGIGIHPYRMDEWGVDITVSGSQKGCMIPPGLAFIAVSERCWQIVEQCSSPRYYLDLRAMRDNWKKTTTPYTPPVSLVRALHKALEMILEEGLENVHARHQRLAEVTRAAMKALGLKLLAENPANGVTAVWGPEGISIKRLTSTMRDKYGVTIAGGQGPLTDKIFRIGHMGYVSEEDLLVGIGMLERVLAELGYRFTLGAALEAAQQVLCR